MASKKAILLVAFGTSVPEARKAFDRIDSQVKAAFPGVDVRWGFTSGIIRAKLAGQGEHSDSPEAVFAGLMDAHYTHVAVLSLHVISGKEFQDLNTTARIFAQMAGGFEKVEVAMPLLLSHDDAVRAAKAVLNRIPRERKPAEAVVFMGHGNRKHPADSVYTVLNDALQEQDENVYLATAEGVPAIERIIPKLKAKNVKRAWLVPFMTIAGNHARNDMAGDKPESWKSILSRNGIESESILTGLAEYPEVVEIWIDHLREAYSKL